MIVTLASWASQDVGHYTKTRKSVTGSLCGGIDLGLRGALGDVHARLLALGSPFAGGAVGDELLLDLVGVQGARLLTVGLVDVVLVGTGLDAEEVVEAHIDALRSLDLVAQAEDFLICGGRDVSWVVNTL